DLAGGGGAHEQRGRLRPVDRARALAAALDGEAAVQEQRADERGGGGGEAPRARLDAAVGAQPARAGRRRGVAVPERLVQRGDRARLPPRVLVEQQRVAALGALQQRGVVLALAPTAVQADDLRRRAMAARGGRRAVVGGVVEHEHLGREGERVALGG